MVLDKYSIRPFIRFGHQMVGASFSTAEGRWTVETADHGRFTAQFLFLCTGYYEYDAGYRPDFPGEERFRGRIVHPQAWTEDVELEGKRVVVIGSGATAITMIPELAERGATHVTMLQRSPSYIAAVPQMPGPLARLPGGFYLSRWMAIAFQQFIFQFAKRYPARMRKTLIAMARKQAGPGVDKKHFTPRYDPWDQRLCACPDGDFFKAIRKGLVSVVTDEIETFTEDGIKVKGGGEVVPADLVVTATGMNLKAGFDSVVIDGEALPVKDRLFYKGVMLDGVPNAAVCMGYVNASWTLKADLTCRYVCRLLNHMEKGGHRFCVPRAGPDVQLDSTPDLSSGYIQRGWDKMPKNGTEMPWRLRNNFFRDYMTLEWGSLDDSMEFAGAKAARSRL